MDRVAHFTRLVAEQPGNDLFRFSLAQALVGAGRPLEAEPHFRACANAKLDWMIPRIALGKILLQSGRAAEAKPVLEDALQLAIDQHHEDPESEVRGLLAEIAASDGTPR
ncbi:MAG TPA: molecular chaperone DnaJ [Opitutaceae bacterium]|nr:molecular chaperone DnaJ [Opitutaceae bacterium]